MKKKTPTSWLFWRVQPTILYKKKKLTKEYISAKFQNDENLLAYLPDNIQLTIISREFLLSVLFYGDRNKYLELYEEYKNTTGNKRFKEVITNEIIESLKNYNPIDL